jgi:hypothetical protein
VDAYAPHADVVAPHDHALELPEREPDLIL